MSAIEAFVAAYLIARKTKPGAQFNNRQLYVKGRSDVADELKQWAKNTFRITEEEWRSLCQKDTPSLF